MRREAARITARLALGARPLYVALADAFCLPRLVAAARRAAEQQPRAALSLPAAGIHLAPRLLPVPASARA